MFHVSTLRTQHFLPDLLVFIAGFFGAESGCTYLDDSILEAPFFFRNDGRKGGGVDENNEHKTCQKKHKMVTDVSFNVWSYLFSDLCMLDVVQVE